MYFKGGKKKGSSKKEREAFEARAKKALAAEKERLAKKGVKRG